MRMEDMRCRFQWETKVLVGGHKETRRLLCAKSRLWPNGRPVDRLRDVIRCLSDIQRFPKRARLLGAAVNNSSNSISAAIKCRHAFLSRSASVAEERRERRHVPPVSVGVCCAAAEHGEHPLFKPRRHGRVSSVCCTSVIKRCCRYHRRALFHSNELKIIHNAALLA